MDGTALDVLAGINRIRRSANSTLIGRLPKGSKGNPRGCVIFEGLKEVAPSIVVGSTALACDRKDGKLLAEALGVTPSKTGKNYSISYDGDLESWKRLISEFDNGQRPDLDRELVGV